MTWEKDIGEENDDQKKVYTKDVVTTVKRTITLEELYRRKQDYEREIAREQARLDKVQADIDEIETLQAKE